MALPDYQTLMLPCLESVNSNEFTSTPQVVEDMQRRFKLSSEQMNELLPSGSETVIKNRTSWSLFYLMKAGLIDRPLRAKYKISEDGKVVLKEKPAKLDNSYLKKFKKFQEFIELSQKPKEKSDKISKVSPENEDPRELFERSYEDYKASVCAELSTFVKSIHPRDFELLVIELLRKMGYGTQSISESIRHTGKAGDGGIDGEIFQDALGLDKIFIQAKRYNENSGVGREDLQKFVGSLNERKSKKGIFITSSYFTETAKDYVHRIDVSISLIDGAQLSDLMYRFNIGVTPKNVFEIKEIDHDFFEN